MPGKAVRSGCSTSVWVRGMQAIVGTAHQPCWKGKMRKYSRWFGVHLGYANVSGRNLRRGRFRFLNASPRDSTLLPSRLSIGSLRIPVFPAPLDFQLAAASRQSLPPCVSHSGSKPYFRRTAFKGADRHLHNPASGAPALKRLRGVKTGDITPATHGVVRHCLASSRGAPAC